MLGYVFTSVILQPPARAARSWNAKKYTSKLPESRHTPSSFDTQQRRSSLLQRLKVLGFVIRRSGYPAPVEYADPFERKRAYSSLV